MRIAEGKLTVITHDVKFLCYWGSRENILEYTVVIFPMHVLITVIAALITDNARRISLFKLTADVPSSRVLLWCCYSCTHYNIVNFLKFIHKIICAKNSTLWDIAVFFIAESFLLDERAKRAMPLLSDNEKKFSKCVAVATKRFDRF